MNEHALVFHDLQLLPWRAHAGFPSAADDYKERPLDINDLVVPHPVSTDFMRVIGDSMTGACIDTHDVIVVDRAVTATHNKIIVARLAEDFTVKRLQIVKDSKCLFLKPENPKYTALEVTHHTDFEIWGIVTWVALYADIRVFS
jgi:DNA polymerase V